MDGHVGFQATFSLKTSITQGTAEITDVGMSQKVFVHPTFPFRLKWTQMAFEFPYARMHTLMLLHVNAVPGPMLTLVTFERLYSCMLTLMTFHESP